MTAAGKKTSGTKEKGSRFLLFSDRANVDPAFSLQCDEGYIYEIILIC